MRSGAVVLFAVLAPVPASAFGATMTFDDRALWEAAAGAVMVEDFESESLGDVALPVTLDSALGVALASGSVSAYVEAGDPNGYGFANTTFEGRNYLAFGQPDETGSYSVRFQTGGSTAIGFDISGWQVSGDPGTGFSITLLNGGQVVDDFFQDSDAIYSDVTFFGLLSDTMFDEFRMHIGVLEMGVADFVAYDDVAWNVPTPGAAALLTLVGVVATRRRRG